MMPEIVLLILSICLLIRIIFEKQNGRMIEDACDGMAQTTGNKEVQADAVKIAVTTAGKLAVMADGIGKEKIGKVCANLAVEEFINAFSFYQTLHNPEYFFERTIYSIHKHMQKILDECQGGASLGAVLLTRGRLHYAVAGQVKITLVRNGELIPLVEGQTIGVLACQAYKDGKLSRQDTIWSKKDNSVWNYIGKDGFRSIEIAQMPIELKWGDLVIMMTKGIFEELSYAQLERVLINPVLSAKEKAKRVIHQIEGLPKQDKENGSILVILTDGAIG